LFYFILILLFVSLLALMPVNKDYQNFGTELVLGQLSLYF